MKKGYIRLICVLTVCLLSYQFVTQNFSPVDHIEIDQEDIFLLVGESQQLTVTGYTEDGETIPQERLEKLGLVWEGNNPQSFAVSEDGLLLGISNAHGSGNVWVKTKDGELNARPVTVTVYKWETPMVVED